ncbi:MULTISPECIES: hypothetical protein [Megasphaera]|uniref:hypothetical protein n=1 Tax=Megasphaera TaxID=906 RepID=UPI00257F55E9|nr:hypothetical protein [Megasphaera sp.]
MPYKESDLLKIPNDKQVIWRYMNYDKFIDLLEKQALYFFNLLKYRKLGDPQEGDLPEYNKNNLGSGYIGIRTLLDMPFKKINLSLLGNMN